MPQYALSSSVFSDRLNIPANDASMRIPYRMNKHGVFREIRKCVEVRNHNALGWC